MEGWVDLGGWLHTEIVYLPTGSRRRSTWAHPTRLDLTWQRYVDLSRLQTTWDVQKLWWTALAWTLYVYCRPRLIIKCFIPSADVFFIVISWRKFVLSVKTVFYDCFDVLELQHATASLAFCRPSVCCPAVCPSSTDVLWLTVRAETFYTNN